MKKFAIVGLQFKFPKLHAVPLFTRQMVKEVTKTAAGMPAGTQVIAQTEGVSPITALNDLESANYSLIDVTFEERQNLGGFGNHYVASYIFAAPSSGVKPSPKFLRHAKVLYEELQATCESALWRARAYANPFRRNEQLVPDTATAFIAFDARKPFVQGDGQPVVIWQKDEQGERIGDEPLPLAPSYYLRAPRGRVLQLRAA